MRKILFRLSAIIIFLLPAILNQTPSPAANWIQDTSDWIPYNSTDAPSILIDTTFHRSTEISYWWPSANNLQAVPQGGQPIYFSKYVEFSVPATAQPNWLSWEPKGWKIENNASASVSVGAGNEGPIGNKEEYCKINIVNPPASPSSSDIILSQDFIFLDPRTYKISLTAKTTSAALIILLITDSADNALFSQEITLGVLDIADWETYIFNFTCNNSYTDAKIKLLLGLAAGPAGGTLKFDEISLVPLDTDIAPPPNEPAGRHGFLQVEANGDYYFTDSPDKKEKFFGFTINISHPFPECPPSHRDSEILAERLAFQGCNVVRIQGIEPAILTPYLATAQIDAVKLDKLDYLIYQLKERGIYIILETLGALTDRAGDDLPEVAELKYTKCRMQNMFDPLHIERLKNYISDLFFEHINPYTNKTYIEDTVNQWIIIANEFNLPMEWAEQKLNGLKYCYPSLRNKFMPECYVNQLNEMWNSYLLEKYGSRENLKKAWGETISSQQPQIGGINLVWDHDFNFSAQQATPAGNGFTHALTQYFTGYPPVDIGWANDYWAYSGYATIPAFGVPSQFLYGYGEVEITGDLGPDAPAGINQAIKIELANNDSGDIKKVKLWPTPSFGTGTYRYDNTTNTIIHDAGIWNPPFNLEANTNYIVTFWAKADTDGQTSPFEKLRLEAKGWYNSNSEANIYYIRQDFGISNEWRQYTAVFTPRFDSYETSLTFYAGGRGNGYLYITGVNLYKKSNNATLDFTFESRPPDYLWKYIIPPGTTLAQAINFVTESSGGLDDRSLQIAVPPAQDIIIYQNNLDLRAGQWYTLAFYAKDESNQQNSIEVSLEDETGMQITGATLAPLSSTHTGSSGWNYYWLPFESSLSRINSTLKFIFHNSSAEQKIYYLDQIKLFGGNQIENGDFYLDSLAGWSLHTPNNTQAQCFLPPSKKYCHIKIWGGELDNTAKKHPGKTKIINLDGVKLEQGGVSLEKNRTYALRFKATSVKPCLVNVKLIESWINQEWLCKDTFNLTPQWNEFVGTFNTPNRNILNAKVSFYFSGYENDINITDIKIEDEGGLLGLGRDEEPFIPKIIRYINFQPTVWNNLAIPDVIGYEVDYGEACSEDRGFGWVGQLSQGTVFASGPGLPDVPNYSNSYPAYGPGKDTTAVIVPNQNGQPLHWRIELPIGKYLVSAACGDPRSAGYTYQTNNYLRLEDNEEATVLFDGDIAVYSSYSCPKPAIYIGEKEVEVNDGYLDVYIGDGPSGNTALRYLIIKQAMNTNGKYIVQRPLFMHLPLSTKAKARDIIEFYRDIENSFYKEISDYLRHLGAKQQIISTQNYWSMPELENQASFDATAGNEYWNFNGGCAPMIRYEDFTRTPISQAAILCAKGKPFLTTEYNELFPDHFRPEGLAMKSAYNSFQGADLLIGFCNWHSYYDRLTGIDSNNSPAFYGMLPVISRMIIKDEIIPSLNEIGLAYTKEEIINSLVKYGAQSSLCVEGGIPPEISLVTGVKRSDFEALCSRTVEDYDISGYIQNNFPYSKGGGIENSEWFISDTNQLQWNPIDGIFTLNTPNAQMIVGYLSNADKVENASDHLDNLDIEGAVTTTGVTTNNINLGFANISLTSLTNQPINASPKLFLSLIGRETNTNQIWANNWTGNEPFFTPPTQLAKINNIEQIGQPPVMAEPVRAKIKIAVSSSVGSVAKVYKLNQSGQRLAEVGNAYFDPATSQIIIDLNLEPEITSIWYVIERSPETVLE